MRMSSRRFTLALLLATSAGLAVEDAQGCCLTDWLFGRAPTPYVAGYAPAVAAPVTAPLATTPYAAAYPAQYASGFTAPPVTAPGLSSGVFQAQRPAYFSNPSVYTGLPVAETAQAAYSAPPTTSYRPAAPGTGGAYLGANNTYPSTSLS